MWVSIGLLMPSCMCSDIYKHLSNLSLSFMVVYILLMLFFIILFCLSSASLTSIQKGQVSRVFPFSVLLGFTFVGSVITNLFAIYKTGGWTGYIIYNDAFYQHAGAMVWNKFKIYMNELCKKCVNVCPEEIFIIIF